MSMALSFCSNWPTGFQQHDQEITSTFRQPPSPELPPELFAFHDDFTLSDTCINPLFEPNFSEQQLFFGDSNCSDNDYSSSNTNDLLPLDSNVTAAYPTLSSYSDVNQFNSILPAPAQQVFAPSLALDVSSHTHEGLYNCFPVSSSPLLPNLCSELSQQFFSVSPVANLPPELPPLPEVCHGGGCAAPMFPWYDCGGGNIEQVDESSTALVKKQNSSNGGGGGSLSAQSIAARVRRRKISEKTQELGKLIPGGHKMNTAEMFQAAFKYIKFLQAQIGVLKLIPSIPGSEEVLESGEFQALVTSPSIQERLYTAEKCIVPKHFEEIIANSRTNSQLSKEG